MKTTTQFGAPPPADLIDRYLANELAGDDATRVAQWIAEDPYRAQVVTALREGPPVSPHQAVDTSHEWARFDGKRRFMRVTHAPSFWTVPRIAVLGSVVAVLALGVGLSLPLPLPLSDSKNTSAVTLTRDYATTRGQRASFELPDGSRVTLAPDTRLQYTESQSGHRTVQLSGQAYFAVTPASSQFFLVRTSGATVKVLGTAFSVRAYTSVPETEVIVAEGKVEVAAGKSRVVLPGGQVTVATGQHVTTPRELPNLKDALGWTRGEYMFRDIAFSDIAVDLERLYDIHIQFADDRIRQRRMTVVLRDEPVDDMLRTLAPVVDASYTRDGRTIVFSAR